MSRDFASKRVKFVEVPVNEKTKELLIGLGVTRLPFAHIYHPSDGLVEELPISVKNFEPFKQTLLGYVDEFAP